MNKKIKVSFIIAILTLMLIGIISVYLAESKKDSSQTKENSWVGSGLAQQKNIIEKVGEQKIFKTNQISEYLKSIGSSFYDEEWTIGNKDYQKVVFFDYSYKNKEGKITIVNIPSKRCSVTDEKGISYGGDIETFLSYHHPAGDYEDKYKLGLYRFCLKPSIFSIADLPCGFDHIGSSDVNIPKECSVDASDLDKKCICDLVKESVDRDIKERTDAILNGNLSWVDEGMKKDCTEARAELSKMDDSCDVQDVIVVSYESSSVSMGILANLNDEILGILYISPIAY